MSEGARLYREILERTQLEQDMKIAARIQQALLPARQRTGEGFELAVASMPCQAIGGDFVDDFDLPSGTLGLVIGDIAGKGPPAALLAAELQGILAAQSYQEQTPGAATLTLANRVLLRRTVEARFATVLYAALSPDGRLTYCNAGHAASPERTRYTAARHRRRHSWRFQGRPDGQHTSKRLEREG